MKLKDFLYWLLITFLLIVIAVLVSFNLMYLEVHTPKFKGTIEKDLIVGADYSGYKNPREIYRDNVFDFREEIESLEVRIVFRLLRD